MWFEACSINETRGAGKNGDIRGLLNKIVSSGQACVEIKGFQHKTIESCRSSLLAAIRRDRLKQLKVTTKDNRIFVINTLMVKDVND